MRIRLLGVTIFEIELDRPATHKPPAAETPQLLSTATRSTEATRPLTDLNAPADLLPRTPRGTVDIDAGLRLFGLADGALLWQRRFESGTAGSALKRALGSQGRMPTSPPLDPTKPDLRTFPAADLLRIPGTNRLDIAASLALFGVEDPAVLWTQRFRPDSAGGRLKMLLGQRRNVQGAGVGAKRPNQRQPGREDPLPGLPSPRSEDLLGLRRDEHGQIDIPASLSALGIADPKSLWTGEVQAGSAAHVLKKEIARALVRGKTVPGITLNDIGLSR